jgi:Ulp1 family protease
MSFFKPIYVSPACYNKVKDPIVDNENAVITKHTVQEHLNGSSWLDNNIINFYVGFLRSKNLFKDVKFLSSFFMEKVTLGDNAAIKRWLKKQKVENADRIVFPMHVGLNHWCAGCIDLRLKEITIKDSVKYPHVDDIKNISKMIETQFQVPVDEFSVTVNNSRQQNNGFDCGIWTCAFMWEFANYSTIPDLELLLSDTAQVREHIKWLVVTQKQKTCQTDDDAEQITLFLQSVIV